MINFESGTFWPRLAATPMALALLLGLTVTSTKADETSESFFIDLPAHGIAGSHGGEIALAAGPPGIAMLTEPAIKDGLALLMKFRDKDGTVVGFASELEIFPAGADMLTQNVVWDTDWTLVIPGRGSIYLHQQEHSGGLGPEIVAPTLESGEAWRGEFNTTTTVGPREDGRGVIAGGSGEFEGASGSFVEIVYLTGFLPEGVLLGTVELRLFPDSR